MRLLTPMSPSLSSVTHSGKDRLASLLSFSRPSEGVCSMHMCAHVSHKVLGTSDGTQCAVIEFVAMNTRILGGAHTFR